MSKKRLNPELAETVFGNISSKHDLYKKLDQHLHVSLIYLSINCLVLCMSIHDVHKGLCKGDIWWVETAH